MDFTFTAEQDSFRKEIRDFLALEMPPDWCGRSFIWATDDEWRVAREFDKKARREGVAHPRLAQGIRRGRPLAGRPARLSGRDGLCPCPQRRGLGAWPGLRRLLPSSHYGSEEQKQRFLPRISTGEDIWCQGFSEPVAGSDLAALETSALADGDEYVINGMKHLVGQGQRAEWCVLAARTDPDAPKHKGVSLLAMDMRLPGVDVELMPTLPRHGAQSRIIMKDVRVPKRHARRRARPRLLPDDDYHGLRAEPHRARRRGKPCPGRPPCLRHRARNAPRPRRPPPPSRPQDRGESGDIA